MTRPAHPLLLLALVLMTTMTAMTASLGAPLVPEIAQAYGVSLADAQWSLTVPLLVGAASTPVLGRLSATRWRNAIVIGGLVSVAAGSVLSAMPPDFAWFLVGRGLQGLGFGLAPVAMTVARVDLPVERRTSAIAMLSVTAVAGAGLAYPVASTMVEWWGLGVTFLAAGGLCLACLALTVVALSPSPASARAAVDWVGTVLLSGGTTAALLGLAELRTSSGATVAVLFAVALVAWVAWVPWSLRRTHPIVDLRLARQPVSLLAHTTSFLVGTGVYLLLSLVIVAVQADWGLAHGPAMGGWIILPYSLCSVVGSRIGLRLTAVTEREYLLPIGAATYLLSFVWITFFHAELWQMVVGMVVAGIGGGLALAAIPALLVSDVPTAETGSSLGFAMVVRYLGFSLGSTLGLFVLTFHGTPDEEAFITAMVVSCAVGVVMVAASLAQAVRAVRLR